MQSMVSLVGRVTYLEGHTPEYIPLPSAPLRDGLREHGNWLNWEENSTPILPLILSSHVANSEDFNFELFFNDGDEKKTTPG